MTHPNNPFNVGLDRFSQGRPDPQEAPVVATCAACGGEIYEGALIYVLSNGEFIHGDVRCLADYYDARIASIEEVLCDDGF